MMAMMIIICNSPRGPATCRSGHLAVRLLVNPLTPTVDVWVLGTGINHPVPDGVKPVICNF